MLRPLLGTGIKPNHLTTLRLISGMAACGALALGTRAGAWWGGALWLVSAFLDRADGELARIGDMMSERGHLYDYHSDNAVGTIFFVAIGIGQRHSSFGEWALALGLVAAVSFLLCKWWAQLLERLSPPGTRAYSGFWGFDPDDALYLMAPFAWLGWLDFVLAGAASVTPVVAAVTGLRLLALRRATADRTRSPALRAGSGRLP